jgi:excisionase family DNA binding protein
MEIEHFVDAKKAAEYLNLRPRRVLELAREGSIPAYPIGNGQRRVWRFRLSELASVLRSHAVNCKDAAVRTRRETD